MRQWTSSQKAAIEAQNRDILVSAAAGSGKTSVLIERVLQQLYTGIPLNRLLILTFTNAAAGEMRDRLQKALEDEIPQRPELRAQLALLPRANISTLHAFCQKLLRRRFEALGQDPLSRIGDEALMLHYKEEAFQQALDSLYERDGDADARELTTQYDELSILDMANALYRFLMARADPWGWLERCVQDPQGPFEEQAWYEFLLTQALKLLRGTRDLALKAVKVTQAPAGPARFAEIALDDQLLIERVLEQVERERGIQAACEIKFQNLPGRKIPEGEDPELSDQYKALRDAVKKTLAEALALLPNGPEDREQAEREIQSTLPCLRALAQMTQDAHKRYLEKKQQKALWDFNDLEHLALKLLSDEGTALEESRNYDALFVDEYQDISGIQEALIKALHRDNKLFMVGDVKQSIYRFRLADPTLFIQKYERFGREAGDEERMISLQENFRSKPNILNAVNLVFSHAMRKEVTEIEYDEEARLKCGTEAEGGEPVELWLIRRDKADEKADGEDEPGEEADPETDEGQSPEKKELDPAFSYEAGLIADRIKELLREPPANREGKRLEYRDIVILLRNASNRAADLARSLAQVGIPCYSSADSTYFALPEVADVMNILSILDNPCDDIPLLGVMAAPCFRFSPEELARLRLRETEAKQPFHQIVLQSDDQKVLLMLEKLEQWRFKARVLPLEQLIRLVMRESGLYTRAGALEDGELRRANLRLLCELASPLPEPQTLHSFLTRVRDELKQERRRGEASLGMQENVVRIMTIHKSKGLEFPVVFMPDLARSFSRKRRGSVLQMDGQTGLALPYMDRAKRLTHPSFKSLALQIKKQGEEMSEESRLLYVGLTRARERLVLIGSVAHWDTTVSRWNQGLNAFWASRADSMLDWIAPPLIQGILREEDGHFEAKGGSQWLIRRIAAEPIAAAVAEETLFVPPQTSAPLDKAYEALLSRKLTRKLIPLKTSVSALVTGRIPGVYPEEEEETAETKRLGLKRDFSLPPLPALDEASPLSAAETGTAGHKALSALPLELFRGLKGDELQEALQEALLQMEARGFLTRLEREAAEGLQLGRFLVSPLGQRLLSSEEYHREWAFTLRAEGGVLLQGVIDLCFLEAGEWVALDYKSDRAEASAVLLRYQDQLRWYRRALQDITGRPVKEAWLYLLRRHEAVELAEKEPIRLGPEDDQG